MDECTDDRAMIVNVEEDLLLDILRGICRITNLPADCRMSRVTHSNNFKPSCFQIVIHSKEFPKAEPHKMLDFFWAEIEMVGHDPDTLLVGPDGKLFSVRTLENVDALPR